MEETRIDRIEEESESGDERGLGGEGQAGRRRPMEYLHVIDGDDKN